MRRRPPNILEAPAFSLSCFWYLEKASVCTQAVLSGVDLIYHPNLERQSLEILKMTRLQNNFKSFCKFTSLHGWHNIVEATNSTSKKTFWSIIVCFSMATASIFLYANTWVS